MGNIFLKAFIPKFGLFSLFEKSEARCPGAHILPIVCDWSSKHLPLRWLTQVLSLFPCPSLYPDLDSRQHHASSSVWVPGLLGQISATVVT